MRGKTSRVGLMMVGIAALALLLAGYVGLERRRERLYRTGMAYARVADRAERGLRVADVTDQQVTDVLSRTHWNGQVANCSFAAARRPWQVREPVPATIDCECSACLAGLLPRLRLVSRESLSPYRGPLPDSF